MLDRSNEPLCVGVEVRVPRRQAQQRYARALQQGPEVRGVEGIAIDDEVPESHQRARRGVGKVAGDLHHPIAVRLGGHAGDVNAPGLEVDDEQHEVAYEAPAREHLHAEEVGGEAIAPQCALSTDGPRLRLPSYFVATCSRYHRRMVSGVASAATSARSFQADVAFPFLGEQSSASASVKRRRLGPSRARRTRFSVRKYSIASPCRRPIPAWRPAEMRK